MEDIKILPGSVNNNRMKVLWAKLSRLEQATYIAAVTATMSSIDNVDALVRDAMRLALVSEIATGQSMDHLNPDGYKVEEIDGYNKLVKRTTSRIRLGESPIRVV